MIKIDHTVEIENYLAFERESLTKHEFLFQSIISMAGASFEHNFASEALSEQM